MNVKLTAADGHELDCYVAEPSGPARGGLVVIQEIFGVNSHIRSVADDFARDGYLVVAPALFDRVQRGVELAYDGPDTQRGMQMARQIGSEDSLEDVAAALEHVRKASGDKKAGVVGYCWGGTLAWLAATRLGPAAAVGYYGGRIAQYAQEKPTCPVMLHFGARDAHIPMAEIDKIRAANPQTEIFIYDAGHGFNCDQRKDFDPASAKLARERTLEFLRQHLG